MIQRTVPPAEEEVDDPRYRPYDAASSRSTSTPQNFMASSTRATSLHLRASPSCANDTWQVASAIAHG